VLFTNLLNECKVIYLRLPLLSSFHPCQYDLMF